MRRGEICALSWRDIDLENKIIAVHKSNDCFGNLKEPKTKAGIRRLPMHDSVRNALFAPKQAQAAHIEKWAAAQHDSGKGDSKPCVQ